MPPTPRLMRLPLADLEPALLPAHARDRATPHFVSAAADMIRDLWHQLGGEATVAVDADTIAVVWSPSPAAPPPLDTVAGMIHRRQFSQAALVLRLLVSGTPDDQEAWLMLGEVLEELGRAGDADNVYRHAIELNAATPLAEQARTARTRIAEAMFHGRAIGDERQDAVMYCVSAIELFDPMDDAEVQRVAFEIGLLAAGGIDVNDPAAKYRLKSQPGEFSGLNLVCMMYVGFQRIEPGADIGFDLRREYEVARGMVGRGASGFDRTATRDSSGDGRAR